MSYAYVIQPPAGFGLLKEASFVRIQGLRKRAADSVMDDQPGQSTYRQQRPVNPVNPVKPVNPAGGTPVNPVTPVNPSGGTPATKGTTPLPAAAGRYGWANRIRDIWDFIVNGLKMLWYRRGAQQGTLTPEQWKTFQSAATALGSNKTAKDLYFSWYGDKEAPKAWGRIEGAGKFAEMLPHMHTMKNMAQDALGKIKSQDKPKSVGGWITGGIKALRTAGQGLEDFGAYAQKHNITPKRFSEFMDYGKTYGYIPEDQYNTYKPMVLNVLNRVNFPSTEKKPQQLAMNNR